MRNNHSQSLNHTLLSQRSNLQQLFPYTINKNDIPLKMYIACKHICGKFVYCRRFCIQTRHYS